MWKTPHVHYASEHITLVTDGHTDGDNFIVPLSVPSEQSGDNNVKSVEHASSFIHHTGK